MAATVESQPPCSVSPVESTNLMDLGEMPLPWRQALEAAVLNLDRDRLQQLLDEMLPSQAHLQAPLEACLKRFEYRRILRALSSLE
ncbi:MAG: hypothetical protein HC890_08130 [Chloroflexaceae bacterium]|nr:hypothetical protein [Chloroflexaceae bacterium]